MPRNNHRLSCPQSEDGEGRNVAPILGMRLTGKGTRKKKKIARQKRCIKKIVQGKVRKPY